MLWNVVSNLVDRRFAQLRCARPSPRCATAPGTSASPSRRPASAPSRPTETTGGCGATGRRGNCRVGLDNRSREQCRIFEHLSSPRISVRHQLNSFFEHNCERSYPEQNVDIVLRCTAPHSCGQDFSHVYQYSKVYTRIFFFNYMHALKLFESYFRLGHRRSDLEGARKNW